MDKQVSSSVVDTNADSKITQAHDSESESHQTAQKFQAEAQLTAGAGQSSLKGSELASQSILKGTELASQGVLAKIELVDSKKTNSAVEEEETDASEHVDVGGALNWSQQMRDHARCKDGQSYYDVMQNVGTDLLGRSMQPEELELLVSAAKALQAERGKDYTTLSAHDELLPKNEQELGVFMKALSPGGQGTISDRQLHELQQGLQSAFDQHIGKIAAEQVVLDLRPVKDQPVVTKVVPNAVYIDSSNIEGGQGYRRKPDCSKETQDYWLAKPTAEAFMKAQAFLIANKHDPMQLDNMNAAGRRALDRELISKCAPGQPHALKHSQHEDGISVDVDNYDDANVRAALTKFGFVHNVPGDRPHFTFLPKRK